MSQVTNNGSGLVSTTLNSFWNNSSEESSSNSSALSSGGANSSAYQATQSYGMNYINQLAEASRAAFVGLGLEDGQRVTFSKIEEYTNQLKEKFAQTVADALTELGVSDDAEYQIVSNYNGEGVSIVSEHEDASKIIQYFNDNPEMVEQFEQIQYLDNVNATRSRESIQANLEISKIQLQSMSSLFSTPASSIMSSGAGSTFFGQGFSTIV